MQTVCTLEEELSPQQIPARYPKQRPRTSRPTFLTWYLMISIVLRVILFFRNGGCDDLLDFSIFLEQVSFVENLENSVFKGVKGSLFKHIDFWHGIGASDFVINTIKEGYTIPFLQTPKQMHCRNIKSAFVHEKFVDEAISELVESGCDKRVPFTPYIVNPLSVAFNKSVKPRLILDLSFLNKNVRKDKFKFEDWKIAIQCFAKDQFLYKFDLKSGHHHFFFVRNNTLTWDFLGRIITIVLLFYRSVCPQHLTFFQNV